MRPSAIPLNLASRQSIRALRRAPLFEFGAIPRWESDHIICRQHLEQTAQPGALKATLTVPPKR